MKGFGEQKESKQKSNKNTKPSIEQIINQAFKFHSQGNILEAAKNYQYLINKGFKDHRVFSNYGSILQNLGKLKEAESSQLKAIELNPDFAQAHYNLGIILKDLGNLQKAELSTRKAIKLNPDFAQAHYNLGIILKDLGKLKEAESSQLKAIELNPNFAEAYINLGTILQENGNLQEAELSTRKAIEIKPDFANAHYNLGNTLSAIGKLQDAEFSYCKAIKIRPDFAQAHYNLGNVLRDLGKLQDAEFSYRKAIKLNPNLLEAHTNLGIVLRDLGKLDEAKISTRKALELNPDYPEAHLNIGNILMDIGNLIEAKNYYKKSIRFGNLSGAKAELIKCNAILSDWSDQRTQTIYLEKLGIEGKAVEPLSLMFVEDSALKQLQRSKNLYKEKYARPTKKIKSTKKNKIHIGYFSADFSVHPVMQLIAPLFELHDKSRFEIYLYSFVPIEDKNTERAKKSGCIFRDIKYLSDIEAVQLARSDKLDIAVDLMGYTANNRMPIFSYRVAPIQINFLGYPGSIGSDTIDYILADKIVIPNNHEQFYTEKILRMPSCYLCNDDKIKIDKEPLFRKDFNLPDQGFIFTCFNHNKKITPNEFDIWMRLLIKIKGSVLWLRQPNEWAVRNLQREAEKRNVDANRLIFASKVPFSKHLARHSLGDLGLDTFNYNGHATTTDALWSGLPILTKMGESFTARVSSTLLTSIGIPELITYDENEYENTALRLASNEDELFELKSRIAKLRDKSPLFNSKLYTQDLENIYLELMIESS